MSKLPKYSIEDIIDIRFIKNHVFKIEDRTLEHVFFPLIINIAFDINEINFKDVSNSFGIVKTKYYKWYKLNFNESKIAPRFYNKVAANPNKNILIEAYNRNKLVHTFEINYTTLFNWYELKNKKQSQPIIDIAKVEEIRKKEEVLSLQVIDLTTPEKIEQVVRDICHLFASGLMTIVEACERNKITYIQFLEFLTQDESYHKMYITACKLANHFHSSRQLSQIDSMIYNILTTGKSSTETISYEKKMIPGQLEPKWIEKKKTITKRDLSITEILLLKSLLNKVIDYNDIMPNSDEFNDMSDEQLLDYIMERKEEIQHKIKQYNIENNKKEKN